MIKNIIFDLSEVIISGYHGVEELLEQEYNIPRNAFFKRKADTLDFFLDTMRGRHTEEEYIDYLIKDTNWNINTKQFKTIIRKNLNIPINGTLDIIKKLKKNYNLILLSDHVKEWMEYILVNNLDIDIFNHKYYSYNTGKLKSDAGCFEKLLVDLEIKPQETIFIDDYENNVNNARKSGINGVLFKNAQDLEQELRKYNIKL